MEISIDVSGVVNAMDKLKRASMRQPMKSSLDRYETAAKFRARVISGALRDSIQTEVEDHGEECTGRCYTNTYYAQYVEFGTGPKGAKGDHSELSPQIPLKYRPTPWYIPIGPGGVTMDVAKRYHWPIVKGRDGALFARCSGAAPHPFMYPAAKDSEPAVQKVWDQWARNILK